MDRDYQMRMIEEFGRVIAKVFFLRDTKQYQNAHEELDIVSRRITGFSSSQLKELGPEGIKNIFDYSNIPNIGKVYFSARIVMEEAYIYELEGKIDASLESYAFALALYEYLKERGFSSDAGMEDDLSFIKSKIN